MFVKNPMKATASSINPVFGGPEKTINGIIKSEWSDMFHSGNENYPWLAIDLGFYYKVILRYLLIRSVTRLHLLLGHRGVNGGARAMLC